MAEGVFDSSLKTRSWDLLFSSLSIPLTTSIQPTSRHKNLPTNRTTTILQITTSPFLQSTKITRTHNHSKRKQKQFEEGRRSLHWSRSKEKWFGTCSWQKSDSVSFTPICDSVSISFFMCIEVEPRLDIRLHNRASKLISRSPFFKRKCRNSFQEC